MSFILDNSPMQISVPYRGYETLLPMGEAIVAAGRREEGRLPEMPKEALAMIQDEHRALEWMKARLLMLEPESGMINLLYQKERRAVRAFHGSIKSVLEMPPDVSLEAGARFRKIYDRLFPDKLGLLILPVEKLWTRVEIILSTVDQGHRADIVQYGGGYALSVLTRVHKEFGDVMHLSKADEPITEERLDVRARALLYAIRLYVLYLVCWVAQNPTAKEVGERCLLPIKKWSEDDENEILAGEALKGDWGTEAEQGTSEAEAADVDDAPKQ